jgi:hypothetical protein
MTFKGFSQVTNYGPTAWQGSGVLSNLTVVDKVPQDMLYLVDNHWYQFAPMNPLWHG